ncbi:uncharacterized protein LOC143040721 isoform X2 [Oratosquilla oratoria]|uniref:uncharacterized protein LOC143040721 isoform X2 n=1 Tax=Oratosquilla oratoria TaxID=337810 RepID=UPI003F76FBAA
MSWRILSIEVNFKSGIDDEDKMSLGQLTANYTDSEGEEEDRLSNTSPRDSPIDPRISDLRESRRGTPASQGSGSNLSGTTTPIKKLNRLVSYANEDEEEEEEEEDDEEEEEAIMIEDDRSKEEEEGAQSEAMDTGTDDGEEEKTRTPQDLHGIKLPPAPPGKCPQHLQDRIQRLVNEVRHGNKDYNAMIQRKKEFRNPSIYEKLIDLLQLDEMGTNYPLDMFDPHCWGKESYYEELAKVQKEEMERREKERKERTKVDIISGTKKPAEEESKKRKSRFDQGVPSNNPLMKPVVAPPTLTSVPSGTKPAIDAFGSLKKPK